MPRTLLALIGGALALAGAASARPDTAAQSEPKLVTTTSFLLSGRGWGHGVGMSQYGALGFANEGRSYAEILAHYYTGTALSPAPVARVRVLVAEAKGAVTVSRRSRSASATSSARRTRSARGTRSSGRSSR